VKYELIGQGIGISWSVNAKNKSYKRPTITHREGKINNGKIKIENNRMKTTIPFLLIGEHKTCAPPRPIRA
jgi:hypothetical protein